MDTRDDLLVWAAFRHSYAAVEQALERELEGTGLGMAAYEVLLRLDAAGGAMRMHDLADHALLTASGLTRLVERLERSGYVERRSCPTDRRGTESVITGAGRKALRDARPRIERAIAEQFGDEFTAAERKAMLSAFRKLLARHGRESALGVCAG